MAQRFGGKYSPSDSISGSDSERPTGKSAPGASFQGARRTRAGGRVNLLFIAPLPLAWVAFFRGGPTGLALTLLALGLLLLAAWLTREGVRAHEAYDARKIARRPAFPRKIAGAGLTGLGLACAAVTDSGIAGALIYGLIGAALHAFAFGPDPMRNKGMEGVDAFNSDRVARAVEAAERELAAMSDAALRTQDRGVLARIEGFHETARRLFRTVEEDPRDLTAARRYLSVYLTGAKDATVKFADIYTRNRDAEARADYFALLDDLEQNFAARTEKLLLDDRSDLTVEIEVLRERLSREGIRPE
ncbi:5-bromo-4-chloroindolyl phosphate hydrolysis family protein [Poseidonocella sedimentorum]|uniref:5-bromo-4-chloroindolyl phosphate hydrolysis protein n=1 Tax=Poseidonocella sedimentorum TaxID=871652 RepID=A0A1I6E5N0_9RHOB|nr:5-bromo-4-chloroindolyl phosphate hydrolysis family protein [Poseidonocella sedimentorum]SFR13050.1 5-bromo-4-chloroindolyl phosphate hydrolysis protein [Poseidonocella sedimentorum]